MKEFNGGVVSWEFMRGELYGLGMNEGRRIPICRRFLLMETLISIEWKLWILKWISAKGYRYSEYCDEIIAL